MEGLLASGVRPLAPLGTLLMGRYKLTQLIGRGAFGQIFSCDDMREANRVLAAKLEPAHRDCRRLQLEMSVLVEMEKIGADNEERHTPTPFGCGRADEAQVHYIVMERLSRNLSEMRKRQPAQTFGAGTVVKVVLQAIDALQQLHDRGWIHRDVKPSNMCLGLSRRSRMRTIILVGSTSTSFLPPSPPVLSCRPVKSSSSIFQVDFGMVRRWRKDNSYWGLEGSSLGERKHGSVGFRGTPRYASCNALSRGDQHRGDDLISLFYSAAELLLGKLPWSRTRHQHKILHVKRRLKLDELLDSVADTAPVGTLIEWAKLLSAIKFGQRPDYEQMQLLLRKGFAPIPFYFDWERKAIDEKQAAAPQTNIRRRQPNNNNNTNQADYNPKGTPIQ